MQIVNNVRSISLFFCVELHIRKSYRKAKKGVFGLKSANFNISLDGENVKFSVIGYGHGVGMSQTGADSMAKQGSDYQEIIKHFYTGVQITEMLEYNEKNISFKKSSGIGAFPFSVFSVLHIL